MLDTWLYIQTVRTIMQIYLLTVYLPVIVRVKQLF